MRTQTEDPLKKFRYRVEIDGFNRLGFMEVSGLSADVSVTEYREGGNAETVQKSPGLISYPDITFKRGAVIGGGDDDFERWFSQVHQIGVVGNPGQFRRSITIIQVGNDGNDVLAYDVIQAWPRNHAPNDGFNGTASENQIESLTVVHEGYITRRL